MRINKSFIVVFALALSLFFASASQAQETPFDIENMDNVVGAAVGVLPDYQGSNDYIAGGAPFFRFTLPQTQYYMRLLATDLQVNVINHPVFRFGPAVNYRFGRNDDVEDNVVKHMKEIDGTMEAGAFVGFEVISKDDRRQRFLGQIEVLSDVGNTYKGYNVSLSASYWMPVSRPVDIMFGAGLSYADENYMKTYFGVDQEDSDRTGMPVFKASSGLYQARLNAGAVLHLSMQWHVAAGVQYRPLLNDAADTPIVDQHGSKDQVIAGLGLAYSW